ncbi:MAG: autotransporter-associated beta strand repeat-containing protein [Akkermansiaceae bacterium]
MKPRIAKPLQIIALTFASAHLVHGDSATWNGTTDATWATSTNWSANPALVPGTGNTATFNNAGNLNTVIDLGAGVTIASIVFDTVDVAAYTIGSGGIGVQSLTLEDSGSISLSSGVNAIQTIHSNIVLGGDGSAQNYKVFNNDPSSDPILETISLVLAGTVSGGSGGVAGPKVLTIDSSSNQRFAVSFKGAISDGGADSLSIVKTGSGAMDFSGATHSFTGGVSVQAGTFLLSGSTLLPPASVVSLGSSGNTGDAVTVGVVNAATNPSAALEVVAQVSGDPTTRVLSAPYPTSGQWSGPITMNDDLTVSATNLAFTLQAGATVNLNSNTLTLINSSPNNVNVSANGIISGGGNVVVTNTNSNATPGSVILAGNNDYTGATTISAGRLQIGNNGATGSIADTSSISNSGTLAFRRTGSVNQGGPISGSGVVRLEANGTVNFDKANTYSGATIIGNGGKLTVATGGSIFPTTGAALTLGNSGSGTLQYDSAGTSKFGAIIAGNGTSNQGTLNQTAGTITGTSLTLNNGYSGTGKGFVVLSGGTMTISGFTTISSTTTNNTVQSTFTISNSAILNANGGLRLTGAPAAGRSGNGNFIQNGGTVTVAGAIGLLLVQGTSTNTATRLGQYDLNGGTVNVNTITSTSTSAADALATFNFNGGTLKPTASSTTFWAANAQTTANVKDGGAKIDTAGFNITITQPLLKFAGSTTDSLTKDGLGTLTLTGANTYSGNTTVSEGTLSLGQVNVSNESSTVSIASDAFLDLGFAGIDTVAKLFINGVQQPASDYTSAHASGRFTGGGTLRVSTGPVASGYSSWIGGFGLDPADLDPTDDPDNDGMDNLLEFALNGNPSISDSSIMPKLVVTATDFEFTYQRRDDSVAPETTQTFQWGTTLATWPGSAVIPAASGPVGAATVTVTAGVPDDAVTDTVKVSIPKTESGGTGKLFGRLQVTKP